MKTKDVFDFYGGRAKAIPILSRLLDMSAQSIYKWAEVVPMQAAAKIENRTKGKIKFNASDYDTDTPLTQITRRYK